MFRYNFAIIAMTLMVSTAAQADGDDWRYHHHHHREHYGYAYNPYPGGGYPPQFRYFPVPQQPYYLPPPVNLYGGYAAPMIPRHGWHERGDRW